RCFQTIKDLVADAASGVRRRAADESGFSMIPASMAVMAMLLMSTAAVDASQVDVKLQNTDRWGKRAIEAAQIGVADYVQKLAVDSDYYSYCDTLTGAHAVNDTDIGTVAHPYRRWLPDPESDGSFSNDTLKFQYTIDLIPANGQTSCKALSDRVATMVDSTSATFRVRVTGRAGPEIPTTSTIAADPATGAMVTNTPKNRELWRDKRWTQRSVVMDFRRRGFLDFAWMTDNESMDPVLYTSGKTPAQAEADCSMYFRDGRSNNSCTEIQFASNDNIKGPFHTNDSINAVTGSTFGRSGKSDRIEISADWCPVRGSSSSSGCGSSSPTFIGTKVTGANAPVLPLPEANEDLATYGDPSYGGLTYTGFTTIILNNNGTMSVTNSYINGGSAQTVNYPTSGVVYVKNGVGCNGFSPTDGWNPSGDATCGQISIKGTYNKSLTFAAEDDIVIAGNILQDTATASADAVLGLIANKFVRVRHYASGSSGSCTNQSGTVTNVEAAILALQHSFALDWPGCGAGLGTLTIKGVIAQKYRGIISQGSAGYVKDYNYDDRMKYRSPPYFLSPAYSGWRTVRYREQTPACVCDENYARLP
ncbi:MAG: hypothetical protein JHC87_09630, partial [Thermoleophilaceae bacterium]|nr:hypothetical protein [Thermoleophilaceae bacterium]